MVNAGLFPDYKVSVGIPTLSSVYISNDFGKLSYNSIFSGTADDSLYFDADKLISQLDEDNHIAIDGVFHISYNETNHALTFHYLLHIL